MGLKCYTEGKYITSLQGAKLYRMKEDADTKGRDNSEKYIVRAYDLKADRDCFLKFVELDEKGDKSDVVTILRREGQFRFFYPYIEQIYGNFEGINEDGTKVFGVSTEYIDGMDLECFYRDVISATEKQKTEQMILTQMMQFLYGMNYYLRYSGQAFLHRDIKPQNIMIMADGKVKIVDFDFSHISGSTETEDLRAPLGGTKGYVSPRVYTRMQKVPNEVDEIYSAGRLLFYWLNGKNYFRESEYNGEGKVPYWDDYSVGYGTEAERFDAKYLDEETGKIKEEYRLLFEIINKMCCNPKEEEPYTSVKDIIHDMKEFLKEYFHGSKDLYEAFMEQVEGSLLRARSMRKERNVTYKVMGSLDGRTGGPLYENAVRDIKIDDVVVMKIYHLENEIYSILMPETKPYQTRRSGDGKIFNEDIFLYRGKKIQIFIN